jgi:Zn-dependent peptidase ImmA (M78 family)
MNGEGPVSFVGSAQLETSIEEAAGHLERLLQWDRGVRSGSNTWDGALTLLRERSESSGVLVMISGIVGSNTHRRLDPAEFRGFALADRRAAVIFVNGVDSKAAQVFTLAHELAHLLLGGSGLDDLEPRSERAHAEERWCSQVAAELLVPMGEFRDLFDPALDIRWQLQSLAEHFRVSTQVVLGRIRGAGHLTWDNYFYELSVERERIAEVVSSRGGGGNFYYTKPVQVSKRFAGEVIGSALAGWTTYTEAMRLLGIKKMSTFEGLAEQLGVR